MKEFLPLTAVQSPLILPSDLTGRCILGPFPEKGRSGM